MKRDAINMYHVLKKIINHLQYGLLGQKNISFTGCMPKK